jgi:endonuclease/exonuclease/phosphatase (EEP) superfamily protein YafD
MHSRRAYLSSLREGVQQWMTDVTYRLRPEHPHKEVSHILISTEAKRSFLAPDEPIDVVVWNTFKGRRERYYEVLAEQTAGVELILLQEFRHDVLLEQYHRELFAGRDASMAVSFYTRPNRESPTGVCTVSAIRAARARLLLSRYFEPVTKTPKLAICTYYPVGDADAPLDKALLVLNSHGINFRLRRPFLDQMLQFEEELSQHDGPIILVGDFNTWEQGRVHILEMVAQKIGLTRVRFPQGVKTVRGHELDRVYVRGGHVARQRVLVDRGASDHNMLSFRFALAG